jgi:hypothetical protein
MIDYHMREKISLSGKRISPSSRVGVMVDYHTREKYLTLEKEYHPRRTTRGKKYHTLEKEYHPRRG